MKTMRHLFRALPLWALLLGVASCDKEDIVAGGNGAEASGERVPMTFTALAPQTGQAQTRTELQPGVEEDGQTTYAVYWNAGDPCKKERRLPPTSAGKPRRGLGATWLSILTVRN